MTTYLTILRVVILNRFLNCKFKLHSFKGLFWVLNKSMFGGGHTTTLVGTYLKGLYSVFFNTC